MNSITVGTWAEGSTLVTVTSGAFWSIRARAREKCLHFKRMWALEANDSPQSHGSRSLSWSAPGSRSEGVRPANSRHSAPVSGQLKLFRWSGKRIDGIASGRAASQRSLSRLRVCASIQVFVVRAWVQAADDAAPAFASESAASLPTMPTSAGVQMPRILIRYQGVRLRSRQRSANTGSVRRFHGAYPAPTACRCIDTRWPRGCRDSAVL
jgi:hypothetical protein